jgi:hypothetical protein
VDNGSLVVYNETSVVYNETSVVYNETSVVYNETSVVYNKTCVVGNNNLSCSYLRTIMDNQGLFHVCVFRNCRQSGPMSSS